MKAALGFLPQSVLVLDPENQKIIWGNDSAFSLLKRNNIISAPADVCRNLADLFTDESLKLVQEKLISLARDEESFEPQVEAPILTTRREPQVSFTGRMSRYFVSKQSHFLRLKSAPFLLIWLEEASSFSSAHASRRDSDQRELVHLSRLADIGRLSAGIAHELNNPLMVIQGYTENMGFLVEDGKMTVDDLSMSIRQVLKATARMSKIISGIKRFVRNDDFNMVKVDLNEIVPEASQLVKSRLQDIEAHVDVEADLPRIVNCDPAQIEQIIINILNNAIHALEEISIERKIRISYEESPNLISLKIWNNGPEVPLEIREKILSPFFTTKAVGEGTGLGLSVSYGIMKSHNGDLRFESSNENGTTFFLDFPKLQDENFDLKAQGKVLVVDDEVSFTWIFANKLRMFGFEVLVAESALDALSIIEREPDLLGIFVDFRMPGMDGLVFTKTVRKLYGSKHIIYLVTGYPLSLKEELSIKRAGVDDLIAKPIPVDQLSVAARILLDHKDSVRSLAKKVV